ncbi:hypothetical protein T4A_4499 [Trichinella pseudospiralis]|uniref:Uncharacterized protein n=1 Tax=Trichinella pseudospiralis TaxID=6337 RepID=A0A0V1EFF0_TRIPS|nr:hypothetical protein T4A_4499 [Trichinella pseudospiralis]
MIILILSVLVLRLLNSLRKSKELETNIKNLSKSLKENVILCEDIVRKDNMVCLLVFSVDFYSIRLQTIKEANALTVENSSSLNDKVEELPNHISSEMQTLKAATIKQSTFPNNFLNHRSLQTGKAKKKRKYR